MANTLRAYIYRDHRTKAWFVDVDNSVSHTRTSLVRPSWPEAMQAAYKLLHDLDRHLMHDVHESRANRRKAYR